MTRVSVSRLKANLSRYLREVRRGGEVEILDRGVPVARLTALPAAEAGSERRQRLSRAGILRQGGGNAASILEQEPLELPTSILAALEEERADRA
ncbi:MAG TPA: type II toxin-antitoxin system prevent-host-death family antitoxin [Thermoanaerobaculia bacterium]|nr:type II toxin-antitoxin system prevent-host-death family antitoxin [Thermoanaerobaculia bacterium]